MAHVTRRSALTIIAAGGASIASGRAWAEDKPGRVIYPVAVPVYQTQFLADKLGYFKEAGLDCKLIQGGSGVRHAKSSPPRRATSASAISPIRCSSLTAAAMAAC